VTRDQEPPAELWTGAGVPDELDRLWTPHRLAYVAGDQSIPKAKAGTVDCPFCLAQQVPDADGLVVARGEKVYALLNLFPYNPGHMLICPYRHIPDYTDLDQDEATELALFTQAAIRTVQTVSGAHGFNVGMNLGAVAGAGIAAHLHQHVVPRWGGDSNFMPVVARTKTIPQLLADTRALLAKAWPGHSTQAPADPGAAPRAGAAAEKPPSRRPRKAS
jgi:ATP adenylyltransferase